MSNIRISLGKKGENLVIEYLKQQGFTILAQNYRQTYGEIDIVAQKQELVAFIEVKLRTNHYYTIADLIPIGKQKKIIKTWRAVGAPRAAPPMGPKLGDRF